MTVESDITAAIDRGLNDLANGEDVATRRMLAIYEQAYRSTEGDLADVLRMVEQARAAGEEISPYWLQRQSRYLSLMDQLDQAYREAAARAGIVMESQQGLAANQGAALASEQLGIVLDEPPASVMNGVSVPQEALNRWASATQPDSPLRPSLDRYGPETADIIEREIGTGIANGYGVDEIARSIERQATGKPRRYDLDRLIRTESMRAYRGGQMDQFRQVESLLQGVMWMAALSPRTCLFCLSMHGKIFPLDQFPDHEHPMCRCTRTPVPRHTYGPGLQMPTGEEYLRSQPEATQLAMIGGNRDALTALRAGKLTLDDFAGLNYSPVWGYSGFQRSGRMALRSKSIPPRTPTPITPQQPASGPSGVNTSQMHGPPAPVGATAAQQQAHAHWAHHGVQFEYDESPSDETLDVVSNGLSFLQGRGGPLPAAVVFIKERSNAIAYFSTGRTDAIHINIRNPFWKDAGGRMQAMRASNHLSTDAPEHVVVHEMAHYAHYQEINNAGAWSSLHHTGRLSRTDQALVTQEVSRYGASHPQELVAEVYTGLAMGKTYSPEIMQLYQAYKGPTPIPPPTP